jgi:hypothetical protein
MQASATPSIEFHWQAYCVARQQAERTHSRADRERALAAWEGWIAVYLPDVARRNVIPLPRLLMLEG